MARKSKGPRKDRRLTLLRYSLSHPSTIVPRVLRIGRLRTLRHWTIMRAWGVYLAKKRETQDLELKRQWQSMRNACEELRLGIADGGRLYRQAMVKKAVFGGRSDLPLLTNSEGDTLIGEKGRVEKGRESGIPIEYAKGLTDTPPINGWDSKWTR